MAISVKNPLSGKGVTVQGNKYDELDPQELQSQAIIIDDANSPKRAAIEKFIRQHNIKYRITTTCNDDSTAMALAAENVGIAFITECSARKSA